MIKKVSDKMTQKRGQTSVEYILIIGVIVGVIMLFGKTFRDKITGITDGLFSNINKNINDGSGGGG